MTPTTIVIVIFAIVSIFAYLISKLIDVLSRIAQRIESTNTHLDEIHNEMAELAQILTTSLIDSHSKQSDLEGRIAELENDDTYDDFEDDQLFEQALDVIKESGKASASLLQRRLDIGYARAARLLDQLEQKGYVGPAEGSKPRLVFSSPTDSEPLFNDAVTLGSKEGKISPAFLQRNLQIGYARAARLMDLLESEGYIGPADGAKPRSWQK